MNQPPRQQPPLIGVEAAVLALGLVAVGIAVATCAGARLAALVAGGSVSGGLTDWLEVATKLARAPDDADRRSAQRALRIGHGFAPQVFDLGCVARGSERQRWIDQ